MRGMVRGLSDHFVVLCKLRLVGAWIKAREVVVEVGELEVRTKGTSVQKRIG